MKFSFFRQRHALSTSFDIFVVTYRVTKVLPKLVDMLFSAEKKLNFHFTKSPIFGYCQSRVTKTPNQFSAPSSCIFFLILVILAFVWSQMSLKMAKRNLTGSVPPPCMRHFNYRSCWTSPEKFWTKKIVHCIQVPKTVWLKTTGAMNQAGMTSVFCSRIKPMHLPFSKFNIHYLGELNASHNGQNPH